MVLKAAGPALAYPVILGVQAVLGALTASLSASIACRDLGSAYGWAVGVLMAVWPHLVTINGYLLSETLYGFLLVATLWLLGGVERGGHIARAIAAGGTAGLAWLTNPVSGAIWLAWAVWMMVRGARRAGVVFALVLALAPLGWSMRNSIDVPTGASSSDDRAWVNLVQGSHPAYHDVHMAKLLETMTPAQQAEWGEIAAEVELGTRSRAQGLRRLGARLAESPGDSLLWYAVRKPLLLWDWSIRIGQGGFYVYPTYDSPFEYSMLFRIAASLAYALNPAIGIGALAGILLCMFAELRHARAMRLRADLVFVALTLFVATAVHVVLQAEPRYAIPYRPFEFIAASYGFCRLLSRLRGSRS